jgi:hypothetical protein
MLELEPHTLETHLGLYCMCPCTLVIYMQGPLDVTQYRPSSIATPSYNAKAHALSASTLQSLALLDPALPCPASISPLLAYEVDSQLTCLQQPVTQATKLLRLLW